MRLFAALLLAAVASSTAGATEPPNATTPNATTPPPTSGATTPPPPTSGATTPPPPTSGATTTPPGEPTKPTIPPITFEQVEQSRAEYELGAKAYENGEYDAALAHFQAAYRAAPSPELFFNMGRCHERLGRWAEAAAAYEKYLAGKPTIEDAVQIRERISDLKLRAQETARLNQPPPAPPPPPPAPRSLRVPAIAVLGAAVVLAAGGTGAWFSEWSDYQKQKTACAGACSPAQVDALRTRVQTAQVAGGVLWALAGAALVADVVLWIADAKQRQHAERRVSMARGLEVHF